MAKGVKCHSVQACASQRGVEARALEPIAADRLPIGHRKYQLFKGSLLVAVLDDQHRVKIKRLVFAITSRTVEIAGDLIASKSESDSLRRSEFGALCPR